MALLPLSPPAARVRPLIVLFGLLIGTQAWGQEPAAPLEDVTVLPPFSVKGDRMEELGVRFSVTVGIPTSLNRLIVAEVFPNSPAAKAGLRPGERVEKIDGKSVGLSTLLSIGIKPEKLQQRLWAELSRKERVTLALEVRASKTAESRTVTLVLPSPPPHWGSDKWVAPEGRPPATVREPGPLATLARDVMNNGIWSITVHGLGYEWRIVQPADGRRIWVGQAEGRTIITLEHRSAATGWSEFITSPSGAFESGWCYPTGQKKKLADADALRAQFETELDFWLHKVGRVTGRWPFEALSGDTAVIRSDVGSIYSAIAPTARGPAGPANAPLAESFLKLPPATPEQKKLFSDALGKIGLDQDGWAFTETARIPGEDHVTTVRYDPGKPPAERMTLLKVDGKDPKPAFLQQWRREAHEPLPGLGELPPLASVVDLNDVRVQADETAALVFELPVKATSAEFPAEKFQARFRVNKTHRGFEDLAVKLRDPLKMGGVAKVTDAGFEVRFQTFDPALAPQPVTLKMGGGVRVLLVNVSRAFALTRTDFKRVKPFEAVVAKEN